MRLLIFGDSITQGFYDSRGGWVQRLASDLHGKTLASMNKNQDFSVEVYNIGISGDTVQGILDRIENETNARRLYDDQDMIIIACGINDSILIDNKAQEDIYEFQEKLELLAEKALSLSDKVYFIGLTAVDEELSDPWTFSSSGKQYKNNRINLFEDTIKQVAINKDIQFIPIHDSFLEKLSDGTHLLSDGLHPNDLGHEFIYQKVKPVLEEMLI